MVSRQVDNQNFIKKLLKQGLKKVKKIQIFFSLRFMLYDSLIFKYQPISLHSFLKKQTVKMYAIVDISGKQYKVEKDNFVYAPLLDGEAGSKVDFDQVLLVDNDGKVKVGAPVVKGAKVSGKILEHVKGDKVIVFKKKRRKGYKKKNGHRQDFSKVLIEDIKG